MKKEELEKLTNFYDNRFEREGRKISSVGWASKEDQYLRFEKLIQGIDLEGKVILDLGCGLGDFYKFLNENGIKRVKYIGLDISEKLITSCRQNNDSSDVTFILGEIFDINEMVDLVISSGAMTWKHTDNEGYTRKVLSHSFEIAREAVSFNFMTDYADYELEKNYHFNPEEIFKFSKSLSRFVNLIHDYKLWEFTVQIFKKNN